MNKKTLGRVRARTLTLLFTGILTGFIMCTKESDDDDNGGAQKPPSKPDLEIVYIDTLSPSVPMKRGGLHTEEDFKRVRQSLICINRG